MPRNVTMARVQPVPPLDADALDYRYAKVRQASIALSTGLSAEDCTLQSMPEASPIKWHLAHTSWFFETFVLEQAVSGYRHFHPDYRVLFNSYYVGVGERHPRAERGLLSRPALAEILQYREHVDSSMQCVLRRADALPGNLRDLIELGLHHEQQHQELMLTDLKHLLSRNPLKPAYRNARDERGKGDGGVVESTPLRWIDGPAGLHSMGHDGTGFAFDNEQPRHRVYIERHALASRLVTNGEYLAFISDGGYTRNDLWLSEGWDTIQAHRWQAPLYWEQGGGGWRTFSLFGMAELDHSAPVCHVSYFEADAYARWAGARLPFETEWEAAASQAIVEGNLAEEGALQPLQPSTDAAECSRLPQQLFGDVWEWTHSAYAPYPGYRTAPGAVGEYNGKFMSNQYVLRGGSFGTPRSHIRATYRNFFPAAARWQFSGIRLSRDPASSGC